MSRGTFSHRHWQFCDQETGESIVPLARAAKDGAKLDLVNSHLSEFGVTGFEWGLSVACPQTVLPIWEAQFGDFFNGAQIVWDAFLSSAERTTGNYAAAQIIY